LLTSFVLQRNPFGNFTDFCPLLRETRCFVVQFPAQYFPFKFQSEIKPPWTFEP
jgi:hypothetical protein